MAKLGIGAALAAGAALMYALDPVSGRRRRARLRDSYRHFVRTRARWIEKRFDDVSNRVHGWATRHRSVPRPHDDDVLVSRVRTMLGHVCAHPHAVQVTAQNGVVELRGAIRSNETEAVLSRARRVPGVLYVIDHVESNGRISGEPRQAS